MAVSTVEFDKFCEAFGNAKAVEFLNRGFSFFDAQRAVIDENKAEIARLEQRLAEVNARKQK